MLRVKLLTLRFSDRLEGFDDEPVQEFVRDKDVVEVRDHFFERDGREVMHHEGHEEHEGGRGAEADRDGAARALNASLEYCASLSFSGGEDSWSLINCRIA